MKLFFASALLLISSLAFGQQQEDTTKSLEAVNVYAIRSQGRDPITKSNISKQDIENNNFGYEPAVIIANTPSILMYSDGGNNNGYMYYRIRGVDQTRINATLNGVPLNEPEDQGAYFSNYPDFLSNVSSIQVQRGIGISSTGTSSFGGSLNFEGPDPRQKYTQLDAVYGSWNTYRLGATFSSGLKKNFATYFRYSETGSEGYRDHSGTQGGTIYMVNGHYKGPHTLKLTNFFGQSENEMAYLGSDEDVLKLNRRDNPLSGAEKDKFYQNLNSLQYTYIKNQFFTFSASAFYNRLKGNYDVLIAPDMLNFQLWSNFYGAIASANFKFQQFDVNVGVNTNFYNRTHAMGIKPDAKTLLYTNRGEKNDYIGWSKVSYTINKLKIYTDVQYRRAVFEYERQVDGGRLPVNPANWDFLNYRVGTSYQFSNKVSAYAMYGTSHREPTRTDMFAGYDDMDQSNFDEIGDLTRVKPETVRDLEVGGAYVTPKVVVKLNAFHMAFRDEIAAIGKLSYIGLPLRKNVDKSSRKGLELEFTVKPVKNLEISGNSTYMKGEIESYTNDETGVTYRNVEPYATPRFYYSLGASYDYKTLTLGAGASYSSAMFMDNENTEVNTGAVFIDPFAKWQFKPWGTLKATVGNLFNVDNYAYGYVAGGKRYSYVLPTRNYQVAVTFKF